MKKATLATLEPAWEIAELYPAQGEWSEREYLALETNRLIEFSDGVLEFLPMPTNSHQQIMLYLYRMLLAFVDAGDLGSVSVAALRVRLWPGVFREPDVMFMAKANEDRIREKFWKGADLVMEVVSGGREDRKRDLVTKRREYAKAKIGEYWIVDPLKEQITVLSLAGSRYDVFGEFGKGTKAPSSQLPGFSVAVSAVMAAGVLPSHKGKKSK